MPISVNVEDATRVVRETKGYFIKKEVAIVGVIFLGAIFSCAIAIIYYSTKDSNVSCYSSVNLNSSVYQHFFNEQFCTTLFCASPLKIIGINIFGF